MWCASLLAAGCAAPFARLDGVLVDAQPDPRPATPPEYGRVQVTHEGESGSGAPRMSIKKGDSVLTAADGVAVLTLAAGYEVILDPGTDVTIENPSIFVRIGRVIIRKLQEVKEALTVKTEIGAAAVEGTQFVFEVGRDRSAAITVIEGRVKVYSIGQRGWDTVHYVGGERGGWIAGGQRLTGRGTVSRRTLDSLRRRIVEIGHVVRPQMPDVVGLPERQAREELERHGLRVTASPTITRKGPVGTVIRTVPTAGSQRRVGDRVQIEVEELSIVVPNVMGQTLAGAERLLEAAGLRLGDTASVVDGGDRDGLVSGMAPSPDAFVRPGTRISLTISRVAIITRSPMCTVPNLIRLDERRARVALSAANLTVGQVSQGETGSTVTSQSVAAGSSVTCGTAVSFMVGVRIGDEPRRR